jgi:hypothetical protein
MHRKGLRLPVEVRGREVREALQRRAWFIGLGAAGLLLAAEWVPGQPTSTPQALKPYAQVTHEPLNEMSGIVKSRRYQRR